MTDALAFYAFNWAAYYVFNYYAFNSSSSGSSGADPLKFSAFYYITCESINEANAAVASFSCKSFSSFAAFSPSSFYFYNSASFLGS
jgi:hypothetical protein